MKIAWRWWRGRRVKKSAMKELASQFVLAAEEMKRFADVEGQYKVDASVDVQSIRIIKL